MSDVLKYSQGQTATFTADFITVVGQPVDVPDASIRIVGPGGSDTLLPTDMIHKFTGFYYYDWGIPNSLPVGTYTAVVSGSVDGTLNSISSYVSIVEAGSPTPEGTTQREIGLIDALNTYIDPINKIPIYNELARRNQAGDVYRFNWPRWNMGNPEIRRNNVVITDGFLMDMDAGVVTFSKPQHETDVVRATYNFRLFSTIDMRRFLMDAMNQINLEAPGTAFSLETIPDNWVGVLLMGATKNALKAAIQRLTFQEPRTIFGDPELAKEAIETYKALKENNEKEFSEEKKKLKRSRWPRPASVVSPEFTLPGGRARWFRYLFSGSV
jgi:hypothetical protein